MREVTMSAAPRNPGTIQRSKIFFCKETLQFATGNQNLVLQPDSWQCLLPLHLAVHTRWRASQEKTLTSLAAHPGVSTCSHGPSPLQRSCRRTSLAEAEIRLFQDWTHWGLADFQIIWICFGMWATAPLQKQTPVILQDREYAHTTLPWID